MQEGNETEKRRCYYCNGNNTGECGEEQLISDVDEQGFTGLCVSPPDHYLLRPPMTIDNDESDISEISIEMNDGASSKRARKRKKGSDRQSGSTKSLYSFVPKGNRNNADGEGTEIEMQAVPSSSHRRTDGEPEEATTAELEQIALPNVPPAAQLKHSSPVPKLIQRRQSSLGRIHSALPRISLPHEESTVENVPEETEKETTLVAAASPITADTLSPSGNSEKNENLTIRPIEDDGSSVDSRLSYGMRMRLKSLKKDLHRRTSLVKGHIQRPPTPEQENSSIGDTNLEASGSTMAAKRRSLTSFVGYLDSAQSADGGSSTLPHEPSDDIDPSLGARFRRFTRRCRRIVPRSIDKQNPRYLVWISVVALAWVYNGYGIPLRSAYPYQTPQNQKYWMLVDYICDLIYLIDLFFFKPRLRFMRGGLPVKNKEEMRIHYLKTWQFKLDVCAILPTDILYVITRPYPLLRLNRVLKFRAYTEFFQNVESRMSNPFILRIVRTLSYMIFIIHCNSCVYYTFSAWQAFGQIGYVDQSGKWLPNPWVYNGEGTAYIRCFYFTTKLATSIGNNPSPTNVVEFVYMWLSWMMGVFVFAVLLGQIRDIVANAIRHREDYRQRRDEALQQCKTLKVPKEIQDRVRQWFDYTWHEQKTMDESRLIQDLPLKLQTDLAISVHYTTLSKVQLFQDCDRALLRDLVLNLKPALFLPGDYICQKGEVGKEMYIVGKGILQVVGGLDNSQVFAELKEGSVFGEISLLSLGGGNRRTASIRSKGYSNLFVLSKEALNQALKDYPDAQKILRRKARQMLKKDEQKKVVKQQTLEEVVEQSAKQQQNANRFVSTVASIMNTSGTAQQKLKAVIEEDERRSSVIDDDSDEDEIPIEEDEDGESASAAN